MMHCLQLLRSVYNITGEYSVSTGKNALNISNSWYNYFYLLGIPARDIR